MSNMDDQRRELTVFADPFFRFTRSLHEEVEHFSIRSSLPVGRSVL